MTAATPASLAARARRLEYLTLAWNFFEAIGSVIAGFAAGSVALVGFGFDSCIELASGLAVLWRFADGADAERRERHALRMVGLCFLALAAYIAFDAAHRLWTHEASGESVFGIAVTAASLLAMPLLARAKRNVARQTGSAALHADSRQTDICAWLSAVTLGGLLLNALLGWWWADPLAALVMAPLIVREGYQAVRGKTCCACTPCGTNMQSP